MSEYRYTIFDVDPIIEGDDAAWPTHSDVAIQSESVESAFDAAEAVARRKAEGDGNFVLADSFLWIRVWDHEGFFCGGRKIEF